MDFDFKMTTDNLCRKIKFEWTINNFSKLPSKVESPPFCPIPCYGFKWILQLEFWPITGPNYMYVNISSLDKVNTTPPLKVIGNITFQNKLGVKWNTNSSVNIVVAANSTALCFQTPQSGYGYYELPTTLTSYIALPDDVLVVVCDIIVSGMLTSEITFIEKPCVVKDKENILKKIYERNVLTDFSFHIGKKIIRAHRVILSARSTVFEKMFQHDTLETQTNSVAINDIDFSVFDCFIGYLYMEEIREDTEVNVDLLLDLYEVADKYGVTNLQKYCADLLISNHLSANTIVKILEIADMHSDDSLKKSAMEFFRNGFSEVTGTDNWNKFLAKNVKLASEVVSFVTSVVNQKESK